MLAHIAIQLPYAFTIPKGKRFRIFTYEIDGYRIFFGAPMKGNITEQGESAQDIKLDGKPTVQANVLSIYFQKITSTEKKILILTRL